MNVLFSIGEKVCCVDSNGMTNLLVEGKTYIVEDINICKCGFVRVDVSNVGEHGICTECECDVRCCRFFQTRFVPLDFDRQADEEIHNALKGSKIYLHKEPKEYLNYKPNENEIPKTSY